MLLNPDGITLPIINLHLDYNFKYPIDIFDYYCVLFIKKFNFIIFEKKKFLKTNEIESNITNIVLTNYLNLPYEEF